MTYGCVSLCAVSYRIMSLCTSISVRVFHLLYTASWLAGCVSLSKEHTGNIVCTSCLSFEISYDMSRQYSSVEAPLFAVWKEWAIPQILGQLLKILGSHGTRNTARSEWSCLREVIGWCIYQYLHVCSWWLSSVASRVSGTSSVFWSHNWCTSVYFVLYSFLWAPRHW